MRRDVRDNAVDVPESDVRLPVRIERSSLCGARIGPSHPGIIPIALNPFGRKDELSAGRAYPRAFLESSKQTPLPNPRSRKDERELDVSQSPCTTLRVPSNRTRDRDLTLVGSFSGPSEIPQGRGEGSVDAEIFLERTDRGVPPEVGDEPLGDHRPPRPRQVPWTMLKAEYVLERGVCLVDQARPARLLGGRAASSFEI